MPEYVLKQGAGVTFPPGPMTIRSSAGARVEVRPRTVGHDVRVVNQLSDQVILPAVQAPVEVHVSKATGDSFTDADRVSLTLSTGERTADPTVATLTEIHCASQVDVVVLLIEPTASGSVVQAVGIANRPPDPAGLASDAVKLIVLGGARPQGGDVAVAVDPSASMKPWLQGGNVRSVIDILAGIDHGLGSQRQLDVCVDGRSWLRVPTDEAGEKVVELLASQPRTSGWGGDVATPSDAHQLYLVTDAVPVHAPADAMVVVLCRPNAADLLTGGRRPEATVCIQLAPGVDFTATLKANPRAANDLIAALAAPLLAEGSPA